MAVERLKGCDNIIELSNKRRYGYWRVSKELRRRGMLVNHKRVARLTREDNLLAVQPRLALK
jgi:hypothetical protein